MRRGYLVAGNVDLEGAQPVLQGGQRADNAAQVAGAADAGAVGGERQGDDANGDCE